MVCVSEGGRVTQWCVLVTEGGYWVCVVVKGEGSSVVCGSEGGKVTQWCVVVKEGGRTIL